MLGSKLKPCKHCGRFGHSLCPTRQRKPLQTRTQLKPKKRIRRIGRIGKKLLDQREQYFIDNPPPYQCIYCLYCGIPSFLEQHEAQIEHGMTKNNHPALRFDKNNLYIACPGHNADKGNTDIDQYLEKLTKQKQEYEVTPGG